MIVVDVEPAVIDKILVCLILAYSEYHSFLYVYHLRAASENLRPIKAIGSMTLSLLDDFVHSQRHQSQ